MSAAHRTHSALHAEVAHRAGGGGVDEPRGDDRRDATHARHPVLVPCAPWHLHPRQTALAPKTASFRCCNCRCVSAVEMAGRHPTAASGGRVHRSHEKQCTVYYLISASLEHALTALTVHCDPCSSQHRKCTLSTLQLPASKVYIANPITTSRCMLVASVLLVKRSPSRDIFQNINSLC